jgi:hypothetical protein
VDCDTHPSARSPEIRIDFVLTTAFGGLARGLYSLKANGKEWAALLNRDVAMDLAGKDAPQGDWKRIIGIMLILAHKPGRNCNYCDDLEEGRLNQLRSYIIENIFDRKARLVQDRLHYAFYKFFVKLD